ncbi:MAG TPA: TlpA disulfide reductase family protein [Phytomonospora sp.]
MKSRIRALAVLAAVALLATACTGPSGDVDAPPSGEQAADWGVPCPEPSGTPGGGDAFTALTLPCLGGGTVTGEPMPLASGTPMVVNMWASWCGPCRDELPAIESFATKGTVAVLGVNTQDTEQAARAIVEEFALTFPSRFDPDGQLLALLGKRILPATVLITAEGTIAHTYTGPALTEDALAALVKEHLGVG